MSLVHEALEGTDSAIFFGSLSILLVIAAVIIAWPKATASHLATVNTAVVSNVSWLFLWLVFLSFCFLMYILLGPWGNIKLGSPDEEPGLSYTGYLVMIFTAGLSSGGLEYWGPVEPLVHYQSPPPLFGSSVGTWAGMTNALQYAIFHYGTSAWSVYLVFGIAVSYFAYRKDMPFRPAVILAPFVGTDNVDGWLGKTVDTLAVVVSVSGITISFGLGVNQFLAGLSYNWGVQVGTLGEVLFILLITVVFLLSVTAGIQEGIKRFANLNVIVLLVLITVALVFGPLSFLLNLGAQAIKGYMTDFVGMSLYFTPAATSWYGSWTVFFWAWWLTFAPMVGVFMARISRGRTLRQLVFAGMLGSFGLTVPWYVATGGSALWLQTTGQADLLGVYSEVGLAGVSFALFEQLLPFANLFSAILLLLVLSFLITTLDSATFSFSMIANKGEPSPSTLNRITWGIVLAALTIALSLAGGISVLRSFTVLAGIPAAGLCLIALVGMIIQLERHAPVLLEGTDDINDRIMSSVRSRLPNRLTERRPTDD
ncbi:BCCT family transporter [Halostagnicola kamekurae]|uniref:Glycine betaine transporter n=1 Tax=Halostagnicola kamekurae TaxID=619731 RepID=A0A1I6UCN2_9EURY|nr:BCCT family transporter [Halostagnicola kamekurae]SFS99192.1 glycine betaine transporter [Halostagnicola kamekurae]